jgi:UDP-3-O-[3-hydroxymyristoyl] glucosamine N-acyltransferase
VQPDVGLTAGEIADLVGGRLVGTRETTIAGTASLDKAGPLDLSFLASTRYLSYFRRSNAGAVLVTSEFEDVAAGPATRIVVEDAYGALALAVAALYPEPETVWGVHPTAMIGRRTQWKGRIALGQHAVLGDDVALGEDCEIGSHAVIETGAMLGDRCRIGSHALVCAAARLGDRVVLNPGARVGTPGYAFHSGADGPVHRQHVGYCYIGDDVRIGANTTVDRGSVEDTIVGKGTKIDNLVQVAHNVRIGERCLIMAQVGLAGSTVVEDDVMLAGQAGLAGHLTVGEGARVAAQAGVIGDISAGETVSGYPARPHRDVLRQAAALKRLAAITSSLERMVEESND